MSVDFFKVIHRNIGVLYRINLFGVLIPKEIAEDENVRKGEEIEVSILRRNVKDVMRLFGTAKTAAEFKRDRTEREF